VGSNPTLSATDSRCSGNPATACYAWPMVDSDYWRRYYEVTAERPAWGTVRKAIELFREEDAAAAAAGKPPRRRFAVDLGCGAGRDARELLRAGWRVLAIDNEPGARTAIEAATEPELRPQLEVQVGDLASVAIPECDLVNASVSLQFLKGRAFDATWDRIMAALRPGARLSAMIFLDRDEGASDPELSCPPPERIQDGLIDFQIEMWIEKEEDSQSALGEPHHMHLVELVARRLR
jgi:tellurite methyltransferase